MLCGSPFQESSLEINLVAQLLEGCGGRGKSCMPEIEGCMPLIEGSGVERSRNMRWLRSCSFGRLRRIAPRVDVRLRLSFRNVGILLGVDREAHLRLLAARALGVQSARQHQMA